MVLLVVVVVVVVVVVAVVAVFAIVVVVVFSLLVSDYASLLTALGSACFVFPAAPIPVVLLPLSLW